MVDDLTGDLVLLNGAIVDGRLGSRQSRMRPFGGLAAKALLAAGEFELLLGHLGLEFRIFGPQGGHLSLQRCDQTQLFVPDRRSLAGPPISSKRD